MLHGERYAEYWARRYFKDAIEELTPFFKLGRRVDEEIIRFPAEAARATPDSHLVAYVKPEEGAWITKGLYWAILDRPGGRWDLPDPGTGRPKYWRRHLLGRLTAAHIHAAREDSRREIFLGLDAEMHPLNCARSFLTSSLKRARNFLASHGGRPVEREPGFPFPTDLLPPADARVPDDFLSRLWRMLTRLARHDAALIDLVRTYQADPPDRRIRLYFTRDSKNRFGRVIWAHRAHERQCFLWPDLELRRLRIPYSARRRLFAFERQREKLVLPRQKLIHALTEILKSAKKAVRDSESILPKLRLLPAPAQEASSGEVA